jgi:hypothetical protein
MTPNTPQYDIFYLQVTLTWVETFAKYFDNASMTKKIIKRKVYWINTISPLTIMSNIALEIAEIGFANDTPSD